MGLQGSMERGSEIALYRMVKRCGREPGKVTLRRVNCT